jgi:hypothetical protein
MRSSHLLLGFSVWAAFGIGCSSSSSSPSANDSGLDGTSEASETVDATSDALEEAAACVPDSSLLAYTPPDASLGGSATVAGCFDCVKNMCSSPFGTCNADCKCNADISELYTCLGSGAATSTCLTDILGSTDKVLTGLVGCVVSSCGTSCPLAGTGPTGGDGGGVPDASGEGGAIVDASGEGGAIVDAPAGDASDAAPE